MNIEFKSKDDNWQDEKTIYWFDVNGELFGLADCSGETTLLDCDGCPIDACNDFYGVKDALDEAYTSET